MAYTGPTITQQAGADAAASTTRTVTLNGVAAGAKLIAFGLHSSSSAGVMTGITDTQGNTWTVIEAASQSSRRASVWQATASSSGNITITGTYSAAINWHLHFIEVSAANLDVSGKFESNAGTTHYSAEPANINSAAQVLLLAGNSLNAAATGWTAASGFTLVDSSIVATHVWAVEYKHQEVAAVNQRGGFTLSGTAKTGPGVIIALTAVSPPAVVSQNQFMLMGVG